MKYLKIEYRVEGLKPEAIQKYEELLQPFEKKYFSRFESNFPNIDTSNIDIVLTDDIWREINKFYEDHGQSQHRLRPKGLEHVVKFASVGVTKKLFWDSRFTGEPGIQILFSVLIEDLIGTYLNNEYEVNEVFDTNTSVKNIAEQLFKIWLSHQISKNETSKIISTEGVNYDDMSELTFAFKKNIRDLHFKYQKDLDNYLFIINVIVEFEIFLRRVIANKTKINLKGFEEFDFEIKSIIQLLDDCNLKFENINDRILQQNQLSILNILKKCDVEIYDSKNLDNIGFKITKGPKDLFPDLIDTHPRIICFIDILGFKSLIDEYENQNISLVLKRLKNVFDATRKAAFEILLNVFQKDIKERLEFKMFSDCIMLSLPYIEFGIDIKSGFHSIAIILNVLQQTFMKEGFYLRGHITLGSYYSDDNMLFSGGLVEAYTNEGTTIYPAVSVNPKIIDKLTQKTEYDDSFPSMKKMIITHSLLSENNNILNPFFTHDAFKSLDSELDKMFGGELKGFGKSIKDIFSKVFENQGVDLDKEIFNDLKTIKDKLFDNYNSQLSIYENFNYSHKARTVASSIIEKYKFLIDLIFWIENEEDNRFKYTFNE